MFQQTIFGNAKAVGQFTNRRAKQHDLFTGLAAGPYAAQPAREPLPGQTSFLASVGTLGDAPASPADPVAAAPITSVDPSDELPELLDVLAWPIMDQLALPAPVARLALPAPVKPSAGEPSAGEPAPVQKVGLSPLSVEHRRRVIQDELDHAIAEQTEMVNYRARMYGVPDATGGPSKADLHRGRSRIARLRAKLDKLPQEGDFRVIVFPWFTAKATSIGTFTTWREADNELARMTEHSRLISGGRIDQNVPPFGWVLCDNDPDEE